MENKILAIKGHFTRGNEVIEILEMLGGNKGILGGGDTNFIYYIKPSCNYIQVECINNCNLNEFVIFTLEQFLEKYPYKVGDKVLLNNQVKTIKGVGWDSNNNEVIYTLEANINGTKTQYQVFNYDLQPYKEEIKAEDHTEIYTDTSIVDDSKTDITIDGEKLIAPNGYTVKTTTMDGNNLIVEYIKNKPQYPKTYKECCEVLGINPKANDAQGYKADDIIRFQELLIYRDAYWKIAGEEMVLFEPWKLCWDNNQFKFLITRWRNDIIKEVYTAKDCFLAFPTKEMRDAFFENFKDLIEKCKEFL